MIKSFNSDSFKVIFSIYTSCQKYCVIMRKVTVMFIVTVNISVLYIYVVVSFLSQVNFLFLLFERH